MGSKVKGLLCLRDTGLHKEPPNLNPRFNFNPNTNPSSNPELPFESMGSKVNIGPDTLDHLKGSSNHVKFEASSTIETT